MVSELKILRGVTLVRVRSPPRPLFFLLGQSLVADSSPAGLATFLTAMARQASMVAAGPSNKLKPIQTGTKELRCHAVGNMHRGHSQLANLADVSHFVVKEKHSLVGDPTRLVQRRKVPHFRRGVDLGVGKTMGERQEFQKLSGPCRLFGARGQSHGDLLLLAILEDCLHIVIAADMAACAIDNTRLLASKRGT